jgi:hypothetical protein
MRGKTLGHLDAARPAVCLHPKDRQDSVVAEVTEIEKVPNRGHSLTIDSGWREVAERALAFVKRFV